MAAWRLTKSLARFRRLVDGRWPNRDHASDGTIGDTVHQAETSGHNPDDTAGSRPEWGGDSDSVAEVRAFDMDSDLREPGTTAQMLVEHLIRLPGLNKVFRYIIFDRKIYRAANGWKPETYTGASPHTEHIHFSGAYSQAADDNETFDFRLDEVGNMALTDDDLDKVEARILGLLRSTDGKRALGQAVFQYDPGYVDGNPAKGAWPGIPDATYGSGGNGTVSLGTAVGTLLSRQQSNAAADAAAAQGVMVALASIANKDTVDEAALAAALAPAVASAVVASLPLGSDQISQEEVTIAVKEAFAQAFSG